MIEFTINGVDATIEVGAHDSLLRVLRDRLGLYGTKGACEQGECGSCSVILDGALVCSCLVLAAACEGSEVTTVEGLSSGGEPTPIQEALVACHAVQCGFCTPGMVVAIDYLLSSNPSPTRGELREALAGNLCRCTGYGAIARAVALATGASVASEDDDMFWPHRGAGQISS